MTSRPVYSTGMGTGASGAGGIASAAGDSTVSGDGAGASGRSFVVNKFMSESVCLNLYCPVDNVYLTTRPFPRSASITQVLSFMNFCKEPGFIVYEAPFNKYFTSRVLVGGLKRTISPWSYVPCELDGRELAAVELDDLGTIDKLRGTLMTTGGDDVMTGELPL